MPILDKVPLLLRFKLCLRVDQLLVSYAIEFAAEKVRCWSRIGLAAERLALGLVHIKGCLLFLGTLIVGYGLAYLEHVSIGLFVTKL